MQKEDAAIFAILLNDDGRWKLTQAVGRNQNRNLHTRGHF